MVIQYDNDRSVSHKELEQFYNRLCEADSLTPHKVMRILILTLGGFRICIPTIKYLNRLERNKRIRNEFRGGNYKELSVRFGLTENMIRKIVHRRH